MDVQACFGEVCRVVLSWIESSLSSTLSNTSVFPLDTTFQGLIPYYFQILYPGRALELNYCVWNNNNFPPLQLTDDSPEGKCASLQEDCEDCRLRPIEEIGLVHFTLCYKPWYCFYHHGDDVLHNDKCAILRRTWFETRLALEESWGLTLNHTGSFHPEESLGFCDGWTQDGYERLELPAFLQTQR